MELAAQVMRTATDLMMVAGLDSEIQFSKKDNVLQIQMLPKSSISSLIAPLVPLQIQTLSTMDTFDFKDGIQDTILTDQFPLYFLSKGFIMNRGVLTFEAGGTVGSVLLLGYPAPLPLIKGDPPEYPDDKSLQNMILKMTEETAQETSETHDQV